MFCRKPAPSPWRMRCAAPASTSPHWALPEADHFVLEMGQPIQDRLAAFFGDAL